MSDRSRDNNTPCAGEAYGEKGVHSPRPLTGPSSKKSDGTEKCVMTGSVDGCIILPVTSFVRSLLCVDATLILSVGEFLPLLELLERPEFDIKPPSGLSS